VYGAWVFRPCFTIEAQGDVPELLQVLLGHVADGGDSVMLAIEFKVDTWL
jgi:hypothetical protein